MRSSFLAAAMRATFSGFPFALSLWYTALMEGFGTFLTHHFSAASAAYYEMQNPMVDPVTLFGTEIACEN